MRRGRCRLFQLSYSNLTMTVRLWQSGYDSPAGCNHELFPAERENVEISIFHILTLWKYDCIRPFIPGILLFCLDFAVFCRNFHKPFFPKFWNPWGTRARHTFWIILPFFRDYSQLTHRQTPRCDGAMLKQLHHSSICFNIHWIKTRIQAFWRGEFEAFSLAENLLQQNHKNVEANKNSNRYLQQLEKFRW